MKIPLVPSLPDLADLMPHRSVSGCSGAQWGNRRCKALDKPACSVLIHAYSLRSNPAFLPPIIQIPTES